MTEVCTYEENPLQFRKTFSFHSSLIYLTSVFVVLSRTFDLYCIKQAYFCPIRHRKVLDTRTQIF